MLPDPRSYSSTLGFNQHLGRHGRAGLKGLFPCCLTMTNFISRTGFFRERERQRQRGRETPCRSPVEFSLQGSLPPSHLGWRVLHRAVVCNKPAAYNVCSEEETVFLVCMECEGLLPLHQYLKQLLLKFWLHFSPTILVFGQGVGEWGGPIGKVGSPCRFAPGPGQDGHSLVQAAGGRWSHHLRGLRPCSRVPAEGTRNVHGDSGATCHGRSDESIVDRDYTVVL